jgi:cytochrome c oxidase subunit 4
MEEPAAATQAATAHTEEGQPDPHADEAHPAPFEYVKIAVVLAAITAAEVAVYYVTSLRRLIVPLLLTMSFVKFSLVALWYMHLKFDDRLFRRLFTVGIVLALVVYGVVLSTFFIFR